MLDTIFVYDYLSLDMNVRLLVVEITQMVLPSRPCLGLQIHTHQERGSLSLRPCVLGPASRINQLVRPELG